MAVPMRAHHLLCMLSYSGEGYSPAFVHGFNGIVQRLVAAVDASGLDRDAYAALVPSRDEAGNALLDAAFAEIGAQHARQDALLRAFEGGSATEAQFADMYGLTQAAVALTLEKARRRRDTAVKSA